MKKENFPKVRLRGGFSDRNGIKPENNEMQLESLDDRTRTALINMTDLAFSELRERISYDRVQFFLKLLLQNVYLLEVNNEYNFGYDEKKVLGIVKDTIRNDDYDSVLTVIEYLANKFEDITHGQLKMQSHYNRVFEKEYVGYRFINGKITPITDENERKAINDAFNNPYDAVNFHISKAISFLADRGKPDYENSIKESISAVEALCEVLTGGKGKEATLGKMLKKIEDDGIVIHSAMKSAFHSLYGYTSDANGIRHAGDIGGPSSTFEEAKFMLVSCSAFINYLTCVCKIR